MILSQKMVMCDMKTLIFFLQVMNNVSFSKKKKDHMSRSSVKYQRKDPIMRNIHVKCQSSSINCSKVINKISVFNKYATLLRS